MQVHRSHVVSYQELMFDCLAEETNEDTIRWVGTEFIAFVQKEKMLRSEFKLNQYQHYPWIPSETEPRPYSKPCYHCAKECFLSAFRCLNHSERISCFFHTTNICSCPKESKVALLRFSDDDLDILVERVRSSLSE